MLTNGFPPSMMNLPQRTLLSLVAALLWMQPLSSQSSEESFFDEPFFEFDQPEVDTSLEGGETETKVRDSLGDGDFDIKDRAKLFGGDDLFGDEDSLLWDRQRYEELRDPYRGTIEQDVEDPGFRLIDPLLKGLESPLEGDDDLTDVNPWAAFGPGFPLIPGYEFATNLPGTYNPAIPSPIGLHLPSGDSFGGVNSIGPGNGLSSGRRFGSELVLPPRLDTGKNSDGTNLGDDLLLNSHDTRSSRVLDSRNWQDANDRMRQRTAINPSSSRLGSLGRTREWKAAEKDEDGPLPDLEQRKQDLLSRISGGYAHQGRTSRSGSARLRSQMLSSEQGGAGTLPGFGFDPTRRAPGSPQVGTPRTYTPGGYRPPVTGDAREPDYSYQYRGTRRYSTGEREYGNEPTYQNLPYYRRNP